MIMLKEFKSFVEKNNLIEKGDKILLALSGGVDSMVLAKLLILYSQRTTDNGQRSADHRQGCFSLMVSKLCFVQDAL